MFISAAIQTSHEEGEMATMDLRPMTLGEVLDLALEPKSKPSLHAV